METIVYYKGKKLDDKCSNSIVNNIMKLSLRKGDSFEFFPFNHFDDEKSDYKEEKQDYHTHLIISNINYTMIETWNGAIKNKIEVHLNDFYLLF